MLRGQPTVFEFPFSSCAELIMAAALPAQFPAAAGTLLASGTLVRGTTEISLHSAGGRQKLATLDVSTRFDRSFFHWTGAPAGAYRVRWTFDHGSYREAPVVVT